MPQLHSGNSSVQSSGAVLYHKSPELLEIMKLRDEVKNVNSKLDQILMIMKGGMEEDGGKME